MWSRCFFDYPVDDNGWRQAHYFGSTTSRVLTYGHILSCNCFHVSALSTVLTITHTHTHTHTHRRYLDAMASKAINGYSAFCRQDFVGIDYGLVDCNNYDPFPDYWSGLLWSKLMGTAVLRAQSTANESVRAYVHCAANTTGRVVHMSRTASLWHAATFNGGFPLHNSL